MRTSRHSVAKAVEGRSRELAVGRRSYLQPGRELCPGAPFCLSRITSQTRNSQSWQGGVVGIVGHIGMRCEAIWPCCARQGALATHMEGVLLRCEYRLLVRHPISWTQNGYGDAFVHSVQRQCPGCGRSYLPATLRGGKRLQTLAEAVRAGKC